MAAGQAGFEMTTGFDGECRLMLKGLMCNRQIIQK